MQQKYLKKKLDEIFRKYHSPIYLKTDPLICVRRFRKPDEIEAVALLVSCLSYGRVEQIIKSVDRVIDIARKNVLDFILGTEFSEKRESLAGFRHRFNDGLDIALLLEAVKNAVAEHGSLEKLFSGILYESGGEIKAAVSGFSYALKEYAVDICGKKRSSFEYLLPSPDSGSACKRLNMFLRWMVRENDGIDLGVWRPVPPSILIIPVDVHVARTSRLLGLCSGNAINWKTAEEITGHLRKFCPSDPTKYDFSLCRYGMIATRERTSYGR